MTDITSKLVAALRASDLEGFHALQDELTERGSLAGESFKSLVAAGFDLSGFDLSNTEWDGCLLEHMKFDEADLEGAYFNGTTLIDSTFAGASMEAAALDGCVFKRTVFHNTNLNETEFAGTDFGECTLEELTLNDVDWSNLTFSAGTVSEVVGASGELRGVTFRNVSVKAFATVGLTLTGCMGGGETIPAGFTALSGNRRRIL